MRQFAPFEQILSFFPFEGGSAVEHVSQVEEEKFSAAGDRLLIQRTHADGGGRFYAPRGEGARGQIPGGEGGAQSARRLNRQRVFPGVEPELSGGTLCDSGPEQRLPKRLDLSVGKGGFPFRFAG